MRRASRRSTPKASCRRANGSICCSTRERSSSSIVSSATAARGTAGVAIKVPMLVLYGEWLAAIGFPIGSAAYLISDQQGELSLKRVGLRLPRKVTIRALPK